MKTEQTIKSDYDEFADSPIPFTRGSNFGVRYAMSFRSDSSNSFDEFSDDISAPDTEEGRLSRALQSWMPDYVIVSLKPREKPPLEPVFSGKLGKERPASKQSYLRKPLRAKTTTEGRCRTAPVRRVPSNESLVTNISLLTCSSYEPPPEPTEIDTSEQRPRKRKVASRASTQTSEEPKVSIWEKLARKREGILNNFMRKMAMKSEFGLIGADENSGESEAFRLFDKDEQKAVYEAGLSKGIKYVDKKSLQRCASMRNLTQQNVSIPTHSSTRRVLSASAKKGRGKPLDMAELKRERMSRLQAMELAKLQQEREKRKGRRGALMRTSSSKSLTNGSTVGVPSSPTATIAYSFSALSLSGHSSDTRPFSPSGSNSDTQKEKNVAVWKGDREILEIDLKKELTQRVKQRISTTRFALKRATGLGDNNEQTRTIGMNEEFPKHTEEDYSHKPRIIQRMRISPHLSDVIHDDIQVRMGRPRYHEIRVSDLEQWNKGQPLNRAHRNLKVFNWLHSLREAEFESNVESDILDDLPDFGVDLELLHVESADEPDVKPLYRAYEVRIL